MNIEKMLAECRAQWEASSGGSVFADYWLGWKAGREALVIDLPAERKVRHQPRIDENTAYNEAIENCRDAIEAAGVKVKP